MWPVLRLNQDRLWEVDACRGIAIWIMVVYHLMWDLRDLGGYDIAVRSGFWGYWQKMTVGLFTILVGVALSLSHKRRSRARQGGSLWAWYVARGSAVFTWGLLIGVVTFVALGPERYVRFGILHLIGLSVVMAFPLLRFSWLNLALGAVVLGLGPFVRAVRPDIPWLEWLAPTPGSGVDYAPVIPMFGYVLVGIFIGNVLYPRGVARYRPINLGNNPVIKPLRRMGQNSLLIYLVHQPILVGILLLTGIADW